MYIKVPWTEKQTWVLKKNPKSSQKNSGPHLQVLFAVGLFVTRYVAGIALFNNGNLPGNSLECGWYNIWGEHMSPECLISLSS